jgi:cytochrome c oxidase subunit 4
MTPEREVTAKSLWLRNGLVWFALLALLGITLFAAYLPLGKFNLVTGLAIAAVKAALVAVVFMQLWSSRPLMRLAAVTGLFWLAILLLLTFTDLVTRPVPI